MHWVWSAMECAEIAAGAGLVGADLDAGTAGAVEAGGLKPDVDMHGSMGGAKLFGELERASGTVGTQGSCVELYVRDIGQVNGHVEAIVGYGIRVAKSGVGTGDAQAVAIDFGGNIYRDVAWPL